MMLIRRQHLGIHHVRFHVSYPGPREMVKLGTSGPERPEPSLGWQRGDTETITDVCQAQTSQGKVRWRQAERLLNGRLIPGNVVKVSRSVGAACARALSYLHSLI